MPQFTPPTYEQPVENALGVHGFSFPVGFVVVINTSDEVTPFPGAKSLADPDELFSVAKAGSGDNGKAVFRRGLTYSITAGEQALLEAAGYTVEA